MGADKDQIHDLSELRDTGLLWLINRVVFHPRGFKLGLVPDSHGNIVGWRMQGDGTEVCVFDPADDDKHFSDVEFFLNELRPDPTPEPPWAYDRS